MSLISNIIEVFSEEEKREFVHQLKRKNRRTDVKNLELFKLIDQGSEGPLDEALYGKDSKNAYHALCKRLQDSLIDFVATKSFEQETSEELEILKLLLAARIFFEHKQYKAGFKTLKRARRKAEQLDLYTILNEIYHTHIQYAHLNPGTALDDLIAASNRNMELYQQEFQLNHAYAAIKEQIKTPGDQSVSEIITNTFYHFDIEIDDSLTFKALYQLMNISASAATEQSDYYGVAPVMNSLFEIIRKKEDRAEKHLFYYIEILHLMAVMSFRKKDFAGSLQFTERMHTEMKKKNRAYYQRFSEKHTIIQALNETYTGQVEKAVDRLTTSKSHSIHTQLLLTTCLFLQKEYQEAYGIIRQFNHSDTWYEKKAGWIWVLKKNIIELLLLIELDKLDLVLSRLQSFKRRFAKRLRQANENRVIQFIKLIELYYESPQTVTTKDFRQRVEGTFTWRGAEQEDIFVMSFYAWLKAKMEGRELYDITLQLVR